MSVFIVSDQKFVEDKPEYLIMGIRIGLSKGDMKVASDTAKDQYEDLKAGKINIGIFSTHKEGLRIMSSLSERSNEI